MKVKVNDAYPWKGYVFREADSMYDNYIALIDEDYHKLTHVNFAKLEVICPPSMESVAAVMVQREIHFNNIIREYINTINKDKLEFMLKYGKDYKEVTYEQ